jgi:hypothetical protein
MNNRTYRRPMFRKGGAVDSAGEGITSGLQSPRPGYNVGKRVTEVMDEMQTVLPARGPKRNLNDFLINFGLDIASRPSAGPGFGGLLTTAAQSAKDPFAQFQQARAGESAFQDKLALGAYDVVKGEQAGEKDFQQKKDLIRLESELNPKLKKVFREEIPEVRINNYADSLLENDFDFIKNNNREIASDIVTYNVFKEKNPDSGPAKKDFRGILPYDYDNKGKPVPNYETITVGQVFYNPEDGLFYERIEDTGVIATDFRALDPFTYD